MIYVLIFGVVGIGACIWAQECNVTTNLQLLTCISNLTRAVSVKEITSEQFSTYLNELNQSSYEKHMFSLIFFQDPKLMYSTALRKFF